MSLSDSVPSLLIAPRALNEPVTCRHSSLKLTGPSPSARFAGLAAMSGVRRTLPAMRVAAARTSSSDSIESPYPCGGTLERRSRARKADLLRRGSGDERRALAAALVEILRRQPALETGAGKR